MEIGEYFLLIVILLLAVSVGSAQLSSDNYKVITESITDGGANMNSSDYYSSVVVGDISGDISSDNYINQLGVFYGLNIVSDNPVVYINSTDGTNKTLQDLNCYATITDPDGDAMNVSVRWYKDGALNLSVAYNNSDANGTAFNAVLDSGNTTKGDVWSCGLRLHDGSAYSDWVNTTYNLTILNSLPTVVLVAPSDASSTYDRTPFFNWTGTDADGDELIYDLSLVEHRFRGALPCTDNRLVEDYGVSNYTPTLDLGCLHDNGYYYHWSVRAQDDEGYGSWTGNYTVNITANITIELIVDEIDFGDLSIWGAYNDTTDNNPSPLVIENKGNSLVDISVNSTALFDNEPDNSSYFQFKIDENSGEEGAFDLVNSIMSWFDMPITGSVIAIVQLNYTDSNDTAEIDINVSSPVDEVSGDKSALVLFTSRLGE